VLISWRLGELPARFWLWSLAGCYGSDFIGLWDDISKVRMKAADRGYPSGETGPQACSPSSSPGVGGTLRPLGSGISTKLYIRSTNIPCGTSTPYLYGIFIFVFVIFVSNAVNFTDGLRARHNARFSCGRSPASSPTSWGTGYMDLTFIIRSFAGRVR